MNKETKKKIEQLINQRKEWLIESLVKFCIELTKEIETLKINNHENSI